jgi:hypothetical protein
MIRGHHMTYIPHWLKYEGSYIQNLWGWITPLLEFRGIKILFSGNIIVCPMSSSQTNQCYPDEWQQELVHALCLSLTVITHIYMYIVQSQCSHCPCQFFGICSLYSSDFGLASYSLVYASRCSPRKKTTHTVWRYSLHSYTCTLLTLCIYQGNVILYGSMWVQQAHSVSHEPPFLKAPR